MKRLKLLRLLTYIWSILVLTQMVNLLFTFGNADNFHRILGIALFIFWTVAAIFSSKEYNRVKKEMNGNLEDPKEINDQ